MGICINYGTSKRRNTEVCINEINEVLSNAGRHKVILLVPEQFSSYYEQLMVEKSIEKGSFFAEVLTFKRLSYRVFTRNLSSSDKYIDNAGKSMLMYKVISSISDKFEAFKKAGKYPAFSGEAVNTIREFKRYGVSSDALAEAAGKAEEGRLKRKLYEMALIYQEYEKQLSKNGYNDADDNLMELARLLNFDEELRGATIWVDGFDGFTPAETEVVTSMMAKATDITFSFCCKNLDLTDRTDVFYPVVKTTGIIQKAAGNLGFYVKEHKIKPEDPALTDRPGELEHLATQYFSYPGIKYSRSCSNIKLYRAETIYEEVRRCALEICNLVRCGEMRYGDVCIVSGLYEEYREYIDAVFSKYNIPVFLDEKRTISKHPLAAYILALLDTYTSKYSYESVMNYLKSSYTDIDYDDISKLDNYIRQWDIKGIGNWTEGDWDYHAGRHDNEAVLDSINGTRRKIVNTLESFFNKLRYGINAQEFATGLFNFLVENGIFARITEDADEATKEGRLDYADELKQSWNFLMEILNQIHVISGIDKQSAEKYRTMLELAFAQKKIGVIPPRTDEVFAGGINKAYGIRAKMLIILGANDPGFPERRVSEGLFTDKDRADIKNIGLEVAPDTKEQVMNSLINTYNLLNLPEKKLYVSYSESGTDGSQRRKSSFFDRFENIFELANTEDSSVIEQEDYILTPLTGMDELTCTGIRTNGGDRSGLARWYKENDLPIAGLISQDTPSEKGFEQILLKLLGNSIESSPTDIENYISCPFKYFAGNALRITERKDFEVSAPDIGSIIHNILKELVGKHINDEAIEREKYIGEAGETLDRMRIGRMFSRDKRFGYLGKRIATRAVESFILLKKQLEAGDFKPVELEAAFGRGRNIQAPQFTTGERSIYLNGRIDRVDGTIIDEDEYYRIIDYKSSDKPLKLYRINEGLDIQLASYLMAYGDHSGIKPAGMYYFTTKNQIINVDYGYIQEKVNEEKFSRARMEGYTVAIKDVYKAMDRGFEGKSDIIPVSYDKKNDRYKKTLTEKEISSMTDRIREIISKNTEKIFRCEFPVEPVNARGTACEYCRYQSICGFDSKKPGSEYRQIFEVDDEDVNWGKNE